MQLSVSAGLARIPRPALAGSADQTVFSVTPLLSTQAQRQAAGMSVVFPAEFDSGVRSDEGGFSLRSPDGISYRVDVAHDVLAEANDLLARYLAGRQVLAVVGPTVNELYGDRLRSYLASNLGARGWELLVIPTGERHKTLAAVENICASAKQFGLDRHGVMLAVGGGVTCDIVGFAAAVFARGVRFVKVNTTLVGQVDVGVGVKTGVNAFGAKNMLGAYHPPHGSINDPAFLTTLPDRQIRCGLGEIVKMAIILDEELFEVVEEAPEIFRSPTAPHRGCDREDFVLRRAIALMMDELCPNLRECELARLVDFGHTFGPIIETESRFEIAHGESVAIDMAISSHLAWRLGLIDEETCSRIVRLLWSLGLPVFDRRTCRPELMQSAMTASWARRGRRLHLVVPSGIGSAVFVDELDDVPIEVLEAALSGLVEQVGAFDPAFRADSAASSAIGVHH